ncbi:MAG: tRNA guanosine(34) transglycosylase Tgt [Deltaproteobacteria bacterium HGW-Deltaproteobacteria-12]|jgi:queuine tRNA-ribosyltransferase|nr:MAG: tRNA guanosine(34) transglycosylase Tgt [Deltaproteobacteria bacterium HGW-Deltaproteobacteria-12]
MPLNLELLKKDAGSSARLGKMTTAHGTVNTPFFMPVGTQGTVKSLNPEQILNCGSQIILCNTYHLYLRPGHEIIKKLGGLHEFMNWTGPILTDSGGFQVFSLGKLRKITPDGVIFRSHIDGSKHFLTPRKAVEVQEALGSDIMMCLDECTPYPATYSETKKSLDLTVQWAKLCKEAKTNAEQALFGIVQGGTYLDLRKQAVEEIGLIGFDGYALGGVSVGEPKEIMYAIAEEVTPKLPEDKPRYLMGVGTPEDIVYGVSCGIDMFDCVIPTRCARHGLLFTNSEKIVIKNARFREDNGPIDETCDCYTCKNFSRGYLRHLYVAGEILAMVLNTIHNVHYYMRLLAQIRAALEENSFTEFKKTFFNKKGGF